MKPTTRLVILASLAACTGPGPSERPLKDHTSEVEASIPAESDRASTGLPAIGTKIRDAFVGRKDRRAHVQVDKPLYRPGETIWIKVWDLQSRSLEPAEPRGVHIYELVSPKGAVVIRKQVRVDDGTTTNDFEVPADVPGGRYLVRVSASGQTVERAVIVASYEPPRIKKTLDFLRDAYGAGDEVTATVELVRATGSAVANAQVSAIVQLDGQELQRESLRTDADGNLVVRFTLPEVIRTGDGLLTVLVPDGGVTESISRSIPIVVDNVDVQLFAEGGQMVEGLPGRIYFSATKPTGEPADIAGRVVDDRGHEVAAFRSLHDGMGRFAVTPEPGRRYRMEITEPVGVIDTFPLPAAEQTGCVLRTFGHVTHGLEPVPAAVWCDSEQEVTVQGVLRDHVLDGARVVAGPKQPGVVYLRPADESLVWAQGVVRVTVFAADDTPLAERLTYRNLGTELGIELSVDTERYAPRDMVTLTVRTTDLQGRPVPAEVALSVVDDTVISLADDEIGHMLARMYLEDELPEEVEEPNFYFDPEEEDAEASLDGLLGTRGWRRFDWQQLIAPPPPPPPPRPMVMRGAKMDEFAAEEGAAAEPEAIPMPQAAPVPEPMDAPVAAAPPPPPPPPMEKKKMEDRRLPRRQDKEIMDDELDALGYVAGELAEDLDWGEGNLRRQAVDVVRVFPAPRYQAGYDGPRTDFRDTIHWAPEVRTGEDGTATVQFHTSDALTTFRVTAEGVGGGGVGHGESVFASSLPFGMTVKLPVAVSQGDRIEVPLGMANETTRALSVAVDASFGEGLTLSGDRLRSLPLKAEARDSSWYEIEVTGTSGEPSVAFAATTGGLKDAFERSMTISPLGFPLSWQSSGELAVKHVAEVDLGEALPGTIVATVQLYPSPVATLTQGMEGLFREPSGCFEQTSSSNYPNVMLLTYLQENDFDDAAVLQRATSMLERGYGRLVGYESPEKGYEWFGGNPGHEALTAYGLVEFLDMQRVWGDVDGKMIERTSAWLMSRRDGDGGYKRDPKALDSFGRASPEVTDAYITWSLAQAGMGAQIGAELDVMSGHATSAADPYLLGLAAGALLETDTRRAEGIAAAKRLVGMQGPDGSWTGADHSITRSGGQNLVIETTALASIALINAGGHDADVREAVGWLNEHRGGYGQWGATQATVLSLRAMTDYARSQRKTRSSGEIELWVNGDVAKRFAYEEGHSGAITLDGFGELMRSGKNHLELRHTGDDPLPFSFAVDYHASEPASSPEATVGLTTSLAASQVPMGETVRLTATVSNTTDEGQPMTVARIGYPGGLAPQGWQLEELRERGEVAFYETWPREIIVYFRELKPSEERELAFDLVAEVPGEYTAPASRAYLYYTDEYKVWTAPVSVKVTR